MSVCHNGMQVNKYNISVQVLLFLLFNYLLILINSQTHSSSYIKPVWETLV